MSSILLIDDKKDNLISIKALLNILMKDVNIITSQSGKEGINIAIIKQPDIILLDILMPVMDGFEVCKKLKENKKTASIPIIMLTAVKTDYASKIKGLELGADAFLTKPINKTELVAQIKVMLRIKRAEDKLRGENLQLEKLIEERTKELSDQEKKYRLIAENTLDVIWIRDTNLKLTYVSPAIMQLRGITPEEAINERMADSMTPDSIKRLEAIIKLREKALAKGNKNYINRIELQQKRKDGSLIWVESISKPIYDENNKYIGVQGLTRNIDDRKKVELAKEKINIALTGSEEKYRSLVENLLEGLYTIQDDKIIFCNKKFADLFGYDDANDLIGRAIMELVTPESHALVQEMIDRHKKGDLERAQYEFHGIKKDGTVILLESLGGRIHINGKMAIQGAMRDISKIHASEENLRKLSRAVDQSPVSILITNLEGVIEYVNPVFEKTSGYSRKELIGHNPRIMKSGHTPDMDYKKLWQTITDGKEWKGEFLNKKKNNELYWESASISPIKDIKGIITHFLGIKEDITLRKQMEKDLIFAKEKAVESDKLKTSFLANMSHEIRTPMNAIMGFSSLLTDDNVTHEERLEFVELINNNSNNLLSLIDDIIDIAKIEAGQLKVSTLDFDFNQILLEIHSTYQKFTKKKGNVVLDFELETPTQIYKDFIHTDPHRLKQILSNLVGNAIKYTEKGSVKFGYNIIPASKTNRNIPLIQFYVKDTGIGIPKEKMNLIFDRFRQADDSHTREFGGTGLGLAISKNIAHLLGGKIHVVSSVGKGSVFYFTIPLIAVKTPTQITTKGDSKEINFSWQDKILLIAEDVQSNYHLLETLLKKTGINIMWVKNGLKAIEMTKKTKGIDLILMDIQMPVLNGYEATKEIRKTHKDLPIIAVTAFALEGDKEKILNAGCDNYISKPIRSKELYSKMALYLNKD